MMNDFRKLWKRNQKKKERNIPTELGKWKKNLKVINVAIWLFKSIM